MAETGGMIYLTYAASSYSMGWLADRVIARGAPVGLVRKAWASTGLILVAVSLLASVLGDARLSLIGLFCAGWGFGFGRFGRNAVSPAGGFVFTTLLIGNAWHRFQ